MPKRYGETVILHHKYWKLMGGLKQPEGCPCGWEDNGETVLFTIKKGCPVHRLDLEPLPRVPGHNPVV